MEQPNHPARVAVNRSDIASFVTVAKRAGPGNVVGFGYSAMFASDDMIGLMRFPGVFLVKQAILASKTGSILNQ
jgi:hypothetical protein